MKLIEGHPSYCLSKTVDYYIKMVYNCVRPEIGMEQQEEYDFDPEFKTS